MNHKILSFFVFIILNLPSIIINPMQQPLEDKSTYLGSAMHRIRKWVDSGYQIDYVLDEQNTGNLFESMKNDLHAGKLAIDLVKNDEEFLRKHKRCYERIALIHYHIPKLIREKNTEALIKFLECNELIIAPLYKILIIKAINEINEEHRKREQHLNEKEQQRNSVNTEPDLQKKLQQVDNQNHKQTGQKKTHE